MKTMTYGIIALLTGVLLLLGGCSDSNTALTGVTNTDARGGLTFTIAWPQDGTRVIPDSTVQITVDVLRGETLLASASATRESGQATATITMNDLPCGTSTVRVNALDAQGVCVALSGDTPVTILANQMNTADIELLPAPAGTFGVWRWDNGQFGVLDGLTAHFTSLGTGMSPSLADNGQRICASLGSEILLMNVDGSNVHHIDVDSVMSAGDLCQSRDGALLAFVGQKTDQATGNVIWNIYTVNGDGGNFRQVTNFAPGEVTGLHCPAISPDNQSIVFMKATDGYATMNLWSVNVDGTNVQQLTDYTNASVQFPAFSPDGSTIAYAYNVDLYIMNADGSNERLLYAGDGDQYPVAYSADGQWLAYNDGPVWNQCDVYVMHLATRKHFRISNNPGYMARSWAP